MTSKIQNIVEKKKKELNEHPAMKFANDAIVLAAARSGTKGYEGKENLIDFLESSLLSVHNAAIESERKRISQEIAEVLRGYPKFSNEECAVAVGKISVILLTLSKIREEK